MTSDAVVIVQLPRGGAADRYLRTYPPPDVASGRVVVDPVAAGPDGRLGPPETGEVVMSVLSPEALTRDRQEVRDVIRQAPAEAGPLVIIVEAAEELREDELAVVLDAAARARRSVILRVVADA
ncbi:MAG: hypothetical protein J2P30_18540 [Actinobacteria bacterium]|nr:hypothetical protein [Actinomycetota bacterium]